MDSNFQFRTRHGTGSGFGASSAKLAIWQASAATLRDADLLPRCLDNSAAKGEPSKSFLQADLARP